jgi:hypothetical protein
VPPLGPETVYRLLFHQLRSLCCSLSEASDPSVWFVRWSGPRSSDPNMAPGFELGRSLEDCTARCARLPWCVGVTFEPGLSRCYHAAAVSAPFRSLVWRLLTEIPLCFLSRNIEDGTARTGRPGPPCGARGPQCSLSSGPEPQGGTGRTATVQPVLELHRSSRAGQGGHRGCCVGRGAGGARGAEVRRRPLRPFWRPLTDLYLCNVYSCQEIY